MADDLNPAPRLLMGPGPINADPRVLRAMSAQLLGQFDPQFRDYMKEASELYRSVFQTRNRWTLLIDGTARSGIEAALVSLVEPGDKVLVPVFGRFGHLKVEIARRCGAEVIPIETDWGTVFPDDVLEREIKKHKPKYKSKPVFAIAVNKVDLQSSKEGSNEKGVCSDG
jgi:(S)-ureidoglycine-glyoxylate aminotransferase